MDCIARGNVRPTSGASPKDVADAKDFFSRGGLDEVMENILRLPGGYADKYREEVLPEFPKSPCGFPGCGKLTDKGYCSDHSERGRRSSSDRGYGSEWRERRSEQLAKDPLCKYCRLNGKLIPATQVDHIRPMNAGGVDHPRNYQSLCHSCHSRKTANERRL